MKSLYISFWRLFAAVVLVAGFALPASADLAAVGSVDPVTGFPIYFEDANGLRVQLCDEFDPNGVLDEQPPCIPALIDPNGGFVDGNIEEVLFYAAVAEFDGPNAEAILAQCVVEAAGPVVVGEGNTVGNVALLQVRDLSVAGDYTVVTPCATFQFTFPDPLDPESTQFRGETGVSGLPTDVPPFSGALPGPVQIFASNGTGAPGFLGDGGGALENSTGLLSSPLQPGGVTTVTVSGAIEATSDQFAVVGKLSGCTDANEAPIANPDLEVTKAETAVIIDVLANDSDVVIEVTVDEVGVITETPVTISPPLGTVDIVVDSLTPAGSGTATANADGTVTFDPAVGFSGMVTFQYTVIDPCNLISNAATVTVLVEDLLTDKADYRIRTGKWELAGSSNFRDLVVPMTEVVDTVVINSTVFGTGLFGAQEVPPKTSAASGEFLATFTEGVADAFDFDLTINVPAGVEIEQAHIHVGDIGVNGPIIFFLCTDLGNAPAGTIVPLCENINGVISVTGTLTANELQAAGGIGDFAGAVAAIQTGGTYINAHSVVNPGGEIRGQVGRNVISLRAGETGPAIGAAEVLLGGDWRFSGQATVSPGASPHSLHAESALGITELRNLRLR